MLGDFDFTYKKNEKDLLLAAVDQAGTEFDADFGLLKLHLSQYQQYHTSLRGDCFVHPTRDNLRFAVALLDTELPQYEERAMDIIQKILAVQDRVVGHDTYGIWPWFVEESLQEMSPPDWNWADFCGKQLLLASIRHRNRFPAKLAADVKLSIFCACEAIIRRNVGPHYTNIAVMGAFVTLLAGELYGEERFVQYGMQRLQRFYDFTYKVGAFDEYNSPTYNMVTLLELSSIYTETKLFDMKQLAGQLLDIGWKMIGEHFHAATKQWAGPHSRCYSTLLSRKILSFLEFAFGTHDYFVSEQDFEYNTEWYKNEISCLNKYKPLFLQSDTRTIDQIYSTQHGKKLRAYTYIEPDFTIGSLNQAVMWNQRRNWLAYICHQQQPAYIHLRVLHDEYDYAAAMFTGAQTNNYSLIGINFSVNGGDTHIGLDKINGKIKAYDLRIRFELGGNWDGARIQIDEGKVHVQLDRYTFQIDTLYANISPYVASWEISKANEGTNLDYVIYSGKETTIDFTLLEQAAFMFFVYLSNNQVGNPQTYVTECSENEHYVLGRCTTTEDISLKIAKKPQTTEMLFKYNNAARSK